MEAATEEGKQALAAFAVDVISRSPPLTTLKMTESNFDSDSIAEIHDALANAEIASLSTLELSYNSAYFDTNEKCVAWATVLEKLPGLR